MALCAFSLCAATASNPLEEKLTEGITVDLRHPVYCEGVLSTEEGGVVRGPNLRIQAKKIAYTRKMGLETPVCSVIAEGDVMFELGDYVFVGERLEYNLLSHTGVLHCVHAGKAPWFIGGEKILICADGSYSIYHGFATTSESRCVDWKIAADEMTLCEDRFLSASNLKIVVGSVPILWLPSLHLDLETIREHPFRYYIGWGGHQGPRAGISYEFFVWNQWRTSARFDYRLNRGPGLGFETNYMSEDGRDWFDMLNYVARDTSDFIEHERWRYIFQGNYHTQLLEDTLSIDLSYEKVRDKDMDTDYNDVGIELEFPNRTQLEVRRQEEDWIASFITRVRVNSFETVKQELPTLQASWRPDFLGITGIISDNRIQASYLNFAYARGLPNVRDYHATRVALQNKLYRPFELGPVNVTPEVGGTAIVYGNGPGKDSRWLAVGTFGCTANAPMFHVYSEMKHVMTPYAAYTYYTFPTINPSQHFIFDINDGWYRLDQLRFGLDQSLYVRDSRGFPRRLFTADLYAYAFFDTPTIPQTIPKVYTRFTWNALPTLRYVVDSAWDFEENQLDHINVRTEWTFSPDFAVSLEYLHRDAYDWRKADRENFVLDSFRSIEELRDSPLSDKRDTALLHFFYRFHPSLAIEYAARLGWNRGDFTRYNEYEINLHSSLRSSLDIKVAYQHREGDDRIALYFSLGAQQPDRLRSSDLVPLLDF